MRKHGQREFDYVVVGGGSAGCVVAGRLADSGASVLMLEAGRGDSNPLIHIPAGIGMLKSEDYEWPLHSVPQKHCIGQRVELRQAKVIGGGGSINAQVFTRGAPVDFDTWATEFGATGWSYADIAPVYRRFERNARFSGPHHGVDGPLGVSDQIDPHPLSLAFVRAGQEAGLPFNPDFNGAKQHGVGFYQRTTWNSLRNSTASAYLGRVPQKRKVTVVTHAQVMRIGVEHGRARSVEALVRGRRTTFFAGREIILSAGAYLSPHILNHSGIGDPEVLTRAGIPVVHELVGVGKNLQDHPRVDMCYSIKPGISMDRYAKLVPGALAAAEYAGYRRGPLQSTLAEAGAFAYVDKDAPAPDQQLHFVPAMTNEFKRLAGFQTGHGVGVDVYTLRPESRGSVTTISSDPTELPLLDPNFLAEKYDVRQMVEGTKIMRDIMHAPSMARLVDKEFLYGFDEVRTEEDYVRFVKTHIVSACHPTGTCSMGTGPMSVVDPQLRVHGIEGLRVADASVMPTVPSCNTQAPTVMVGERLVDFVLGTAAEPVRPNVERAQRTDEAAVLTRV